MPKNAQYVEPNGYFKDEWLKEAGLGQYSPEYKADKEKEKLEQEKQKANKAVRDFVKNGGNKK